MASIRHRRRIVSLASRTVIIPVEMFFADTHHGSPSRADASIATPRVDLGGAHVETITPSRQ
jgi:hypothetical protein